ncbi:MAG: YihY/virulence factor BrkB family protein, partial [Actinomycetota bacterium]|nr:YihY/virulence factor BrkB family protein [Actinomycetota bacterium]
MSLFPALLLGISVLGLVGQYPDTYEALLSYLREVVPASMLEAVDAAVRGALQSTRSAVTALLVGIVAAFYGTTGALEAARRALNVSYETRERRGFVRRKATDVGSTVVLMVLVLVTLVLMFVGGGFAEDIFGFIGLGSTAATVWNIARWPGALAVAMLVFAWVYFVTPNVRQRSFKWITPGAVVGVLIWVAASAVFFLYVSNFGRFNAIYGTFAAAVILLVWVWISNVALLLGAEVNAEIEREKELDEGVPRARTLRMPRKGG